MGSRRHRFLTLFCIPCCAVFCLSVCASFNSPDVPLQGRLRVEKDHDPVLQVEGRSYRLISADNSISATLGDERLTGRELKVVGAFGERGSFDVHEFFVVRASTLYKVIYFCEVCNITTFKPGNCLCCQAPTVLMEVDPDDPRVYHDDVKKSPPE